jgi:hypothetical protein
MNEDLWGYEDPWALALQTQDWPPRLKAIKPAWTPTVKSFFESKAGLELTAAVQKRLKQGAVIIRQSLLGYWRSCHPRRFGW